MRVLSVDDLGFTHKGGTLYMIYQQTKERLAQRATGGTLAILGLDGDPMTNDQFPPTSRYHDIEIATLTRADGRTIAYLRRRFVPPPERMRSCRAHGRAGERLDQIAALYLGDPEQFWRIADANGAMAPEELTDTPAGGCASRCRRASGQRRERERDPERPSHAAHRADGPSRASPVIDALQASR